MTLPDPSLDAAGRLPATERNQDPARTAAVNSLSAEASRPLTSDEHAAAEHDEPLPERVYAPASERVPKPPVPGHRDVVADTDPTTPERQAAAASGVSPAMPPVAARGIPDVSSPPVSAVPGGTLPSSTSSGTLPGSAASGTLPGSGLSGGAPAAERGRSAPTAPTYAYARPAESPTLSGLQQPTGWSVPFGPWLWAGLGAIAAGVGIWLYRRWQQERQRPMNRLRRQARHAAAVASQVGDHVPSREELGQPAMGLAAAVLAAGLVVWRRLQPSSPRERLTAAAATSAQPLSDADLLDRLNALKARWAHLPHTHR